MAKTLEDEILEIEQKAKKAFNASRGRIGEQLKTELSVRIMTDVYDKYTPSAKDPDDAYIRRRTSGGLLDLDTFSEIRTDRDMQVSLTYEPDGYSEQADPDWSLDGDALIARIETGNPPYDWKHTPPARPFLSNMMENLVEGGEAERMVVSQMNQVDPNLGAVADGSVSREPGDWGEGVWSYYE